MVQNYSINWQNLTPIGVPSPTLSYDLQIEQVCNQFYVRFSTFFMCVLWLSIHYFIHPWYEKYGEKYKIIAFIDEALMGFCAFYSFVWGISMLLKN